MAESAACGEEVNEGPVVEIGQQYMEHVERLDGDDVLCRLREGPKGGDARRSDLRTEAREAKMEREVISRYSDCFVNVQNLHIGSDGGPIKAAPLPFEPIEVGTRVALFRPEGLNVYAALVGRAEDTFIIEVWEPAGMEAVHGGANDLLEQGKFDEVYGPVVWQAELMT